MRLASSAPHVRLLLVTVLFSCIRLTSNDRRMTLYFVQFTGGYLVRQGRENEYGRERVGLAKRKPRGGDGSGRESGSRSA